MACVVPCFYSVGLGINYKQFRPQRSAFSNCESSASMRLTFRHALRIDLRGGKPQPPKGPLMALGIVGPCFVPSMGWGWITLGVVVG